MSDPTERIRSTHVQESHVFQRKERPDATRGDRFKRALRSKGDVAEKVKDKRRDEKPSPMDLKKEKAGEITVAQQGNPTVEARGDLAGVIPKEQDVVKAISGTEFTQERGDIAQINPNVLATPEVQAVITAQGEGISRVTPVQQMLETIQNEMVLLEKGADSETTVTIGKNSLFAGAEVTLTKFSTDPTSFNIQISNLTAQMRELLDGANAKAELMKTLGDRGFVVHMIETSYQPHTSRIADIEAPREAQREQADDDQGQDQRRQGKKKG